MSVVDTATNAIIANVPTGPSGSNEIALDPEGTRLYLSNGAVIDTATNTLVATLPLHAGENVVRGIALTPNGMRLYAAITSPPSVIVIDVNTGSVVATIPIGWGTPYAMG
ncbi:MAG: YncE family protein, partial [Casimicrobiaceae bacterium]